MARTVALHRPVRSADSRMLGPPESNDPRPIAASTRASAALRAAKRFADIAALTACALVVVRFVAVVMPGVAALPCYFQTIDISMLVDSIDLRFPRLLGNRQHQPWELNLMLNAAGLSAKSWMRVLFAVHLCNSGLLLALGRGLGLRWRWAAAGALLFAGMPTVADALRPSYVIEIGALMGFLGVMLGYLARGKAMGLRAGLRGFGLECAAILLGSGNKIVFILYPALLITVEAAYFGPRDRGLGAARWRPFAIRVAPSALLAIVVASSLLPELPSGSRYRTDWSPASLLATSAHRYATTFLPAEASWALAVGGVLVAALLWSVFAPASSPAQRVGAALAIVGTSTAAALPDRFFPGYGYHFVPGVALFAAALWDRDGVRIARGMITLWVASLLTWRVQGTSSERCVDMELLHAAQRIPESVCAMDVPAWNLDRSTASRALERLRSHAGQGDSESLRYQHCLTPRPLPEAWSCLDAAIPRENLFREEHDTLVRACDQLVIVRCANEDSRAQLAPE